MVNYIQFFNGLIRVLTLSSKFFLFFFLARLLEPSQLGIYGLLAAAINYALFAVGFEFYTYSTRELVGLPLSKWGGALRNQGIFYIFTYIIVLPLVIFVFIQDWLPWYYLGWFLLLLLLEHLSQELNRVFVIMSDQLFASTLLFFRSGIWCFLVVLLMWIKPEYRRVDVVLCAWMIGAATACILGLIRLKRIDSSSLSDSIDWAWIRKGIFVAAPYLCAALAIRGLFTFDRYWVKEIAGLDILGAYVLFIGLANGILSFLDAGVFVFMYPQLISAAKQRNSSAFFIGMKKLMLQTFFVLFSLSICVVVFAKPLCTWLIKPIYYDNVNFLYWSVAAVNLFSLSMVPQIGLYSYGKDSPIIVSHLIGFIVFVISAFVLSKQAGVIAVPWSLCIAFLCVLLLKTIAYYKLTSTALK